MRSCIYIVYARSGIIIVVQRRFSCCSLLLSFSIRILKIWLIFQMQIQKENYCPWSCGQFLLYFQFLRVFTKRFDKWFVRKSKSFPIRDSNFLSTQFVSDKNVYASLYGWLLIHTFWVINSIFNSWIVYIVKAIISTEL